MKQVVRKTKIKYGEVYTQNGVVRPYHQNFQIGENVRITKKRKIFDKGYTERQTEEVFKISKIQLIIPVTYKITDYTTMEIQGSFYEQELQKTKQDMFRIKKIIRR